MKKILANWIMAPDGTMIPSMHRHDYRTHNTVDSWKRVHIHGDPEPNLEKISSISDEYNDWFKDTKLEPNEARFSMADGGTDYLRRGGVYTEMSIYDDDSFELIRRFLCRGGRGVDGKQPLTYVPLFKMDDEWLKACISYNKERGVEGHNKWYQMELDYRNNPISMYRVGTRGEQQGLWYKPNGEFTGNVHTESFNFLGVHGLAMDFDPEVVGWLSATDTLENLYMWFSAGEIRRLQKMGYYIYEYEVTDRKWYDKFNHWLINQETSKMVKRIELL